MGDVGRSITEIKSSVAQAKSAFTSRKEPITFERLTEKRFIKICVYDVTFYGCEAWASNESEQNLLESYETLWCWRRMTLVSRKKQIINDTEY